MSWFERISQKTYPGGDFQGLNWDKKPRYSLDYDQKLKYWGVDPSSGSRKWNEQDMARNMNLTRIDSRNVKLIIEHFANKYYQNIKPAILRSVDPCRTESFPHIRYDKEQEPEIEQSYESLRNEIEQSVSSTFQRAEIIDNNLFSQIKEYIKEQIDLLFLKIAQKEMINMPLFVRVYGSSQAFGGHEEGGWWYTNNKMIDEKKVNGRAEACSLAKKMRGQMERQKYELARQSYMASAGEISQERARRIGVSLDKLKSIVEENKKKFPTFEQYINDPKIRKNIDSRYASDVFYGDLMNFSGGVRDLYDESSSGVEGMGDLQYDQRDTEGMDYPRGWTTSAFENYFVTVEATPYPKEETTEAPHYE